MAYLIHFNKNHSSKDGRFVSGDGDGDGIPNDHANRSKENRKSSNINKKKVLGISLAVVGTAAIAAGTAYAIKRKKP